MFTNNNLIQENIMELQKFNELDQEVIQYIDDLVKFGVYADGVWKIIAIEYDMYPEQARDMVYTWEKLTGRVK